MGKFSGHVFHQSAFVLKVEGKVLEISEDPFQERTYNMPFCFKQTSLKLTMDGLCILLLFLAVVEKRDHFGNTYFLTVLAIYPQE